MGRENRPTCSTPLSLRQPSAEEREEGDAGYAMCSSRRIGHEGPDVPPQCSFFSLIYALGIALQHTLCVYLHPLFLRLQFYWCQSLVAYLMWSRGSIYGCRTDALFSGDTVAPYCHTLHTQKEPAHTPPVSTHLLHRGDVLSTTSFHQTDFQLSTCALVRMCMHALVCIHLAHTPGRRWWREAAKKRREEREEDRQREKHVSPWEELGSFLSFL